jgi:hypothetical protein
MEIAGAIIDATGREIGNALVQILAGDEVLITTVARPDGTFRVSDPSRGRLAVSQEVLPAGRSQV